MKHTILLLITILISSCGMVQTKEDISNNRGLSQLERDVATCEIGKSLYTSCTPYSGFSGGYEYDYFTKDSVYVNTWVDECPNGEYKVSLNLFGAKTYVKYQDIKQCMNEKGYSYKAPKWIKNKIDSVFVNGKYIKAETYLNRILTPKDKSIPETNKPFWEVRAYPKASCRQKYDSFYCNKRGTFYEGEGEFIKEMYYPKSIIDNLYQAGYTIEDIGKYSLKESRNTLKTPINIQKQAVIQDKSSVRSSVNYIESLKKAKDLFSSGAISEKEFESIKAKIIDEI